MKLNVSLKYNHQDVLDQFLKDFAISNREDVLLAIIKFSLKYDHPDDIFGEEREECNGGCFNAEPAITIELDIDLLKKMKQIYHNYTFDDYDSEDEEISKTIRCKINYANSDGDPKEIFYEFT